MSRTHLVMTAAHGGYDSNQVPLGGGAAVCERLCEHWRGREDLKVTLIGSGPQAPEGIEYLRCPTPQERTPSSLNEWDYAKFCRTFEHFASDAILAMDDRPVVISHDISEGPSFYRLAVAGVRCLPIFHVDVVDYFNRFYLKDLLPPSWWTWGHRLWRQALPVPDVLQLVFEKQLQAVEHCPFLLLPSAPMEKVLRRCYPQLPAGRVQIVPWGAPSQQPDSQAVELSKQRLRERYQLEQQPILLTLSRISPEKNQSLLLQALQLGERRGQVPAGLTLLIAGEAAYMSGQSYHRRLQRLAQQLHTRVIFTGHLGGAEKRAALELADLFVVPSCHESYGLTTMEAMAASLPVVGMRSYGVSATLDSDSGVLVESEGDAASNLWSAVSQLLNDGEQRQRLAQGAGARAQRESFPAAAARIEELVARLRTS